MTRAHASIWALTFLSLAAATLALFAARDQLGEAHVALVFLLVVLGASAAGGRILGILRHCRIPCFDWFFLPPYNTLLVRNRSIGSCSSPSSYECRGRAAPVSGAIRTRRGLSERKRCGKQTS